MALRTQQIIAYESGVTQTVDPMGGSWYLETLTDEIEEQALAYIERIDELGGAVAAVEQGYMQREIQRAALETQKGIESGEEVVVGVNRFRLDKEEQPELYRVDPVLAREQVERLESLRQRRNGEETNRRLAALKRGAEGNGESDAPDSGCCPCLCDCRGDRKCIAGSFR